VGRGRRESVYFESAHYPHYLNNAYSKSPIHSHMSVYSVVRMTNCTQLHSVPKVSVWRRVRVSVRVIVRVRHRVALASVLLSGSRSAF